MTTFESGPAVAISLSPVPLTQDVRPPTTQTSFDYDVAIVGLGYVGLPTALAYHAAGSRVLALDVSQRRLSTIRAQDADLLDGDRRRLATALQDDGFALTDDQELLSRAAAIVVCVPTPVDVHLVPDLSLLAAAAATAVAAAVVGQLLMLTSTTYIGCTEDFLVTPLRKRGLAVGSDVHVVFSAERINPGVDQFSQEVVPRVVGGATPACEEAGATLLGRYADAVHRVSSLEVAEMTKILENTFRAVNIALANEFADVCSSLGVPVTEVIDAAATKPYGFMPFYPGPGVGGHCIPCDPHYLLWQLKEERVDAPMITQAMTRIAARPRQVVDRIRDLLLQLGLGLEGTRVHVIGIAYKPDVADLRESPALEILSHLDALGVDLAYTDSHIPSALLHSGRLLESVDDPSSFDADLILIHTRHTGEDLSWIRADQVILDSTYRGTDLPGRHLL
ncbi:nucleotide sugar dehydrogenase [Pseudoclavibacter sp. RFBG4]|uniref:nucleotide sugar dehydrogenase n=1 Tax=Pseudoclavibacter sp. RFBG4 TaxID=2080575 RepID=UPI000CE8E401|nr:nucleotide sugar dehydrogenase [Pseudoclavibacter sp. RFBG4]PPG25876.1 nucleotide sugar dehydrogenase [Pseudoclavibacter sp. RFBG4]